MDGKSYANIMVLGRTGVGKSTFINYLLGKDVCKTGIGEPVTPGFDTYEFNNISGGNIKGLSLRIYDSKGLEVKDYQTIKDDIITFLKKQCNSDNIYEWIHSIFYCVNIGTGRLEPEETAFIQNISETITQTIHIILTNCEKSKEGRMEYENMRQYIRSQLKDSRIRIFGVNSVDTRTRAGRIYPAFGRDAVLEQIFEMLWHDIARKVAGNYARDLHEACYVCLHKAEYHMKKLIDDANSFKLLKEMINDSDTYVNNLFEDHFDTAESDIEKTKFQLKIEYQKKLEPLIEFCNKYGVQIGFELEIDDPFDFFAYDFDIDIDEIFSRTDVGKFMDDLDNLDEDNIWEMIGGIGKGLVWLASWKKHIKSTLYSVFQELYHAIPSKQAIERNIYSELIKEYTVSHTLLR